MLHTDDALIPLVGVDDAVGPNSAILRFFFALSGSAPSFFSSTVPSCAVWSAIALCSTVDASTTGVAGMG